MAHGVRRTGQAFSPVAATIGDSLEDGADADRAPIRNRLSGPE